MEFATVTETMAFFDLLIPGSYEGVQLHLLQRTVMNARKRWLELAVGFANLSPFDPHPVNFSVTHIFQRKEKWYFW